MVFWLRVSRRDLSVAMTESSKPFDTERTVSNFHVWKHSLSIAMEILCSKIKKKFFYFDDLHVLMPLSSLKIRISSNQIYPGRSHPCSFVCNIDINSKILFHIFISWSLKFKFTKALWQLIVKEIIELMFR